MSTPKNLNELSASELERLIDTITSMVADRLGLPPDGGSAYSAPAAAPAAAPSCGCGGGASAVAESCSRPASGPTGPAASAPAPKLASGNTDRMSVPAGATPQQCRNVAKFIDHTLLKPNAKEEDVLALCREAREHGFASVCVNGWFVELVANALKGSDVMTCAVVGFPLGAMTPEAKAFEAADAIRHGADEIDMVINIGALKSRHYGEVLRDIEAVRHATRGKTLKVIIETSLLDEEEKRAACVLSKAAEADFVKTSTGFNGGGATPDDIALMRATVGPKMGVKASGGVRTCEDAVALIANGATRLGASAGVAIIKGDAPASKSGY